MTEDKKQKAETTKREWIDAGHNPRLGMMIKCSICGFKIKRITPRPEFCAGCTARGRAE